jgi:predicted kinase
MVTKTHNAKLQTTKPLLILLYGFPGSGKTYFARQLSENLQSAHIQGDRVRHELFENPRYDKQENSIVKQLMIYMTEEFLTAGVSVIYDVNAGRRAQRRELRELARKKGAETIIVWFQMDADTAFDRTQDRDKRKADDKYALDYTVDIFRNYISYMQHPQNEDYVVVSGKHVYASQQTAVLKKLIELGYIDIQQAHSRVAKPDLINLIPRINAGRVDMGRRNINIR